MTLSGKQSRFMKFSRRRRRLGQEQVECEVRKRPNYRGTPTLFLLPTTRRTGPCTPPGACGNRWAGALAKSRGGVRVEYMATCSQGHLGIVSRLHSTTHGACRRHQTPSNQRTTTWPGVVKSRDCFAILKGSWLIGEKYQSGLGARQNAIYHSTFSLMTYTRHYVPRYITAARVECAISREVSALVVNTERWPRTSSLQLYSACMQSGSLQRGS